MTAINDQTFPGLNTALDPQTVLGLMQRELEPANGLEITGVKVREIRYRPGESCSVLYKVRLQHRHTRNPKYQEVSARLLQDGEAPLLPSADSIAKFGEVPHKRLQTPAAYLPDSGMMLYTVPVDPCLPWLLDALDPARMKQELNRIWNQQGARISRVSTKLLRYRAQARAIVQYSALVQSPSGGEERRRFIGKMHPFRDSGKLFARSWALWSEATRKGAEVPEPVGYIGPLQLTLQERVKGQPLSRLIDSSSFVTLVRRAAQSIAAIHSSELPLSGWRTPENTYDTFHRRARIVTSLRPDLASQIERLSQELASEIERRTRILGPVHGDFQPGNILVDRDRVVVVDLDGVAYGDPLADVGHFLASLQRTALRRHGNISSLDPARQAFLDEYLTLRPEDETRAYLFEAAYLISAAASTIRFHSSRKEVGREVEALLKQSSQRFEAAQRVPTIKKAGETSTRASLTFKPQKWSQDPVYLRAMLDTSLREVYDSEVSDLKVMGTRQIDAGCEVAFQVLGTRKGQPWGVQLKGVSRVESDWPDLLDSGPLSTYQSLWLKLNAPPAPLLPRAIGYISDCSMLVFEKMPEGRTWTSMLDSSDAIEAAAKVARSLASLHQTPIEGTPTSDAPDAGYVGLMRQVCRLAGEFPALADQARGLVLELNELARDLPKRAGPILGRLRPEDISLVGDRMAFPEVGNLALGHPLLDAGDLLARTTLMVLQGHLAQSVVDCLRDAYLTSSGTAPGEMSIFEGIALTRLALESATEASRRWLAEQALAAAKARLEVARTGATGT